MRFLLDMGISPATAAFLRDSGYEAVHLLDQNLGRLADSDILIKARNEDAVLLTHDLDFADLVAASGARLPSVIVFRLRSMRPQNVNDHLASVLEHYGDQLEKGTVISVTESRVRLRALPLRER
jgi:predicted nuclease of predicted toxin-antitoxin system